MHLSNGLSEYHTHAYSSICNWISSGHSILHITATKKQTKNVHFSGRAFTRAHDILNNHLIKEPWQGLICITVPSGPLSIISNANVSSYILIRGCSCKLVGT